MGGAGGKIIGRKQNRIGAFAGVALAMWGSTAFADPTPDAPTQSGPFARATVPDDPTGGAYTTPTLLFIPAAAVPTWNVRVITSLDIQGPTAPDRLAVGTTSNGLSSVGFQPGVAGELGLPGGFTFGAGTIWVGGDPNTMPNDFGGLSPYFQLRFHIYGDGNGQGFQLGTSATYKFVGFGGNGPGNAQDPGEIEWAVSGQYRQRFYEVGLQGVIGKDFATTDADSEIHAYAVIRPIPQLALGAASQLRIGLVEQLGEPRADVIAGAIASLTLGRWQLAALGGESTVGLNNGTQIRVGALGEIFATARF
jgi:hypothetical protein